MFRKSFSNRKSSSFIESPHLSKPLRSCSPPIKKKKTNSLAKKEENQDCRKNSSKHCNKKKYNKNHTIVGYEKVNDTTVLVASKPFVKRQKYSSGYYFECTNSRKNEHLGASREKNCNGRLLFEYPLQEKGSATLVKEHNAICFKMFEKLSNPQATNTQEGSDKNMNEIIREMILKDPSLVPSKIVTDIKEAYPERFEKVFLNDIKPIVKRIEKELDFNTINYAFKNPNTLDDQPFLRGHYFSFLMKNKEYKKIEYLIWISNSQNLRAMNAKHFIIDGTFDITLYGFAQTIVVITNDLVTSHPKPLAYILLSSKDEEAYRIELLTNHGTRK